MLINYLKIAWRNLLKEGFYSAINISGLAIAAAVFLLIINFVQFEYSYENFHTKADDIYRVTYNLYQGAKYVTTDCETHPPLAALLKKVLPEVVDAVRIQDMDGETEVNYQERFFRVDKTYAADPSIFHIFSYTFIHGDPATALMAPMRAVLTETQSRRIFGNTNIVGKSVRIGKYNYAVTGVIKDQPANTHLKVDMLLSFSSLTATGSDMNSWNGNNNYTYLQLVSHVDLKAFNEKLKRISHITLKGKISNGNLFSAEPIKNIHLYSHKSYEPETNGDAKSVKFMLMAAILILLVGAVNYINLTTARSAKRIKEIGMRKLLGSSRKLLITQLLVETMLVNLLALGLALVLIRLALPIYVQLLGRTLPANFFNLAFWTNCGALFIFNCLLSGLYPAISLSATKPIRVISRTFTASGQSNLFRKALVVGQFATALIVLSASFVVYQQLAYMQQQNIGLNTAQVLVLKAPSTGGDSTRNLQTTSIKNALAQLPGVTSVAASGALPGVSQHDLSSSNGFSRYGSTVGKGYNFYLYGIDEQFIPTMEIQLAAGENFRAGQPNGDEVIINEAAARLFGFASPAAATGQHLNMNGMITIRGVIKDYHQLSLKEAMLPMIHYYRKTASYYAVKLKSGNPLPVLSQVQAIWKQTYPGFPLEYHFLNGMIDQQYKNEQRFGKVVSVFSFLTLFITCLGILGLTAYNINIHTREIGIRKVLGASVTGIVQLLSFDFVKLILLAMFIATPIAWYTMNFWLNDFAYRVTIKWWVFAITGLIALVIALVTLGFQSIRAALMKPVRALKME